MGPIVDVRGMGMADPQAVVLTPPAVPFQALGSLVREAGRSPISPAPCFPG